MDTPSTIDCDTNNIRIARWQKEGRRGPSSRDALSGKSDQELRYPVEISRRPEDSSPGSAPSLSSSDSSGNLLQESTAMVIVGEKRGLFPELKRWVAEGRPVSAMIFGTTYRTEDLGHLRRHDSPLQPCSETKRRRSSSIR